MAPLNNPSLYTQAHLLDALQTKLEGLHKEGSRLRAHCPNCDKDATKSARSFYTGPTVDFASWHCHACDYTAPTAFLLGTWSSSQQSSLKQFTENGPTDIEIESIRSIYADLTTFAQKNIGDRAISYLYDRGLDDATIQNERLGYIDTRLYQAWVADQSPKILELAGLPKNTRGFGRMFAAGRQGKIVFPYIDEHGQIQDVRTRSISDADQTADGKRVRYIGPKRSPQDRGVAIPYGANQSTSNRILLTEGEFKRLVPMANGIDYVLSLRGANDALDLFLPYMRNKLVVLAFDNDDAGFAATIRNGRLLRAHGISVMALDPIAYGHYKAIDDMLNGDGPGALTDAMGYLLTLNEFEKKACDIAGLDLDKFKQPRADKGTVKYSIDSQLLDETFSRPDDVVSVDDAAQQIYEDVLEHLSNWQHTDGTQLLRTDGAGVGKTTQAIKAARQVADTKGGILGVFFASHEQIDEKISEGILPPDTLHVYGRRLDAIVPIDDGRELTTEEAAAIRKGGAVPVYKSVVDAHTPEAVFSMKAGSETPDTPMGRIPAADGGPDAIRNCVRADEAAVLSRKGYAPDIVCHECPLLKWCRKNEGGYKNQAKGKRHRAFTHAHLHTNAPEKQTYNIIDEATHKNFTSSATVWGGDIESVLGRDDADIGEGARGLLSAIQTVFNTPNIGPLAGFEFYEVLARIYPDLFNVDKWQSFGVDIQMSLSDLAQGLVSTPFVTAHFDGEEVSTLDQLPDQFYDRLFTIMADDVRSILDGRAPSGRLQLDSLSGGKKRLAFTFRKGNLGDWFYRHPAVLLNATADAETLNDLMGPLNVRGCNVAIADGNEIIHDVRFNNAKSSLTADGSRARWVEQIQCYITDEADTTIICAKSQRANIETIFPAAKVAHFMGLEGRNDLESGTIILAGAIPVNMGAIVREAVALWPGIDTTIERSIVGFDQQDASGQTIGIEQFEAVDPRLQRLINQHRDAPAIQALHRARLVRRTGRKVVCLFSRPIPGVTPTQVITEKARADKRKERTSKSLDAIVNAARHLLDTMGGFNSKMLIEASEAAPATVRKYYEQALLELRNDGVDVNWIDVPMVQVLANGAEMKRDMRLAMGPECREELRSSIAHTQTLYVDHDSNYIENISTVIHVQSLESTKGLAEIIPSGWGIDLSSFLTLPQSSVNQPPLGKLEEVPAAEVTAPQGNNLPDAIIQSAMNATGQVAELVEHLDAYAQTGHINGPTLDHLLTLIRSLGLREFVKISAYTLPPRDAGGRRDAWVISNADQLTRLVNRLHHQLELLSVPVDWKVPE